MRTLELNAYLLNLLDNLNANHVLHLKDLSTVRNPSLTIIPLMRELKEGRNREKKGGTSVD